MLPSVRQRYEAYPDPSPEIVPIGPGQLDRIDDNLHYGWSWSRHHYCYRRTEHPRILDAGCGTGLSTLGLAQLNPGSTVLGVDATSRALELARQRGTAAPLATIEFRAHDLDDRLPAPWGPFDFIVCRGVLAQSADPARILRNLAAALDPRGLLYLTIPARLGRTPARQMRQAVEAVAPAGATLETKASIGLELFRSLRPDHPIRRYEAAYSDNAVPHAARFVAGYLNEDETDWTLSEAIALLETSGWKFLYAATRAPWRADRVLATATVPEPLKERVNALDTRALALLIDALDPMLHADEYRIYACLAEYEPHVPDWVEDSHADPSTFGRLIPHRTGLARPDEPANAANPPRTVYRTVTGARGELPHPTHRLLEHVDGVRSCAQIDAVVAARAGVIEPPEQTRGRWLELANTGFILLESADRRQHVDCVHLGPVVDRLDCACPRRWIRKCDLHQHCTLAVVSPTDERYAAVSAGLARLHAPGAAACANCADYAPEE